MTTYERIIMLIKLGKTPIVKDEDWEYSACIYQKDWMVFISWCVNGIDNIYINNWSLRNKEEIEYYNREIVRIDTPEKHIFKAWDIIDLDIEALEKTSNWEEYKKNYGDGKWLEIKSICNERDWLYYRIKTKDKSTRWNIWAEFILPHQEEDDEIEKAIELLTKAGRLKDWKILE